ncbi:kielin/chordin-like protein [Mytilus trossulus]|uniref:kielin/chordin-like protein n=1 Tax=Mytilus trossulus TaxID=6551 RepID=UPI003006ECC4
MLQRTVSPVYVLAVIYMFSIIGPALGSEKYGDCVRYAEGETKPDLPNGDRFCNSRVGWDYEYCIEFKCPPTACEQPLVAPYKKCPYCKGTCSYGGIVYQVGASFLCLDRYNRCHCRDGNSTPHTKVGVPAEWMCLNKKP